MKEIRQTRLLAVSLLFDYRKFDFFTNQIKWIEKFISEYASLNQLIIMVIL